MRWLELQGVAYHFRLSAKGQVTMKNVWIILVGILRVIGYFKDGAIIGRFCKNPDQ